MSIQNVSKRYGSHACLQIENGSSQLKASEEGKPKKKKKEKKKAA